MNPEEHIRPELLHRLGGPGAWRLQSAGLKLSLSGVAQQLLGAAASGATDRGLLRRLGAAERARLLRAVRTALRQCVELDLELSTTGANPTWLRVVAVPVTGPGGRVQALEGAVAVTTGVRQLTHALDALSKETFTAYESITDGFFKVDRQYRLLYINRVAEAVLRMSRLHDLGRCIWDVYPREEHAQFLQQYELAFASGRHRRFQTFYEPQQRWFEVNVIPAGTTLGVFFRDVTESRQTELALREREEDYRMLFECGTDAVMQSTPEGTVHRANTAACRLFGLSEEELCRRGRDGIIAPEDSEYLKVRAMRAATGYGHGRALMVRADGSRFWAEISTANYALSGGNMRTIVVFRDITERLRQEEQLQELNARLAHQVRQRTAQLEAANAELKEFAHSLAHDLRAPLAAVEGFGKALADTLECDGDEVQRKHAARVLAAGRRMREYIDALLALAAISQQELQMQDVSLTDVAVEILEGLRARHPERQVACQVDPGMVVRADRRLLRMALENLLENAWKFTARKPRSEICVTRSLDPVAGPVFCVRDNGAGFDMDYGHKLFKSFGRLHSQEEFPGTGVGLANVQRIIARHGGRIWAEGAPEGGAAFHFTLHCPGAFFDAPVTPQTTSPAGTPVRVAGAAASR